MDAKQDFGPPFAEAGGVSAREGQALAARIDAGTMAAVRGVNRYYAQRMAQRLARLQPPQKKPARESGAAG